MKKYLFLALCMGFSVAVGVDSAECKKFMSQIKSVNNGQSLQGRKFRDDQELQLLEYKKQKRWRLQEKHIAGVTRVAVTQYSNRIHDRNCIPNLRL